jgi:hydroxyacylglutathione hydrolase
LQYLEQKNLTLTGILITHHHADHTGGILSLLQALGSVPVYGPASIDIPARTNAMMEGDKFEVSEPRISLEVYEVPGHTLSHIAYFANMQANIVEPMLFCGDTLFASGCGRLFEGTAAQMYDNMRKLEALGDATAIYCAHEYTLSNARFAVTVEPGNAALQQRVSDVVAARERGEATVPTTIALERATNPFMRASSVEELAARRAAKDAA